ncbi:23S rRNA pseudouridine1911/1915/1917 synthase [Pullulanibacillus pueri]|uniref:Pseudouridine synthase n=1 Tax=Pullulanibacillus pueri TaxID=1437324 RepID=A0A8J2ZT37_9BACL|nr:RluA family pseudouridine synthase [Pullulanibacillus pueri]MBM7680156.1 23S rRNA pseudouridine1911/1915/1917 synthase [Pullulanibacillus pueri]GGH74623.1 putative RNA pseudouridine synthase YlyB [Pullulanibacillus pueri]
MTETNWKVEAHIVGDRIDKYIHQQFPELSRTQIQELIKVGDILVNDTKVKQNYKINTDDVISVTIREPEPLDVKPEPMNLDIVYEDKDVIVINKPRGMVVHPAPGHTSGTLVNGLVAHCEDLSGINGVLRPGIVHRIDKDTSGLIMVAKNDQAHRSLVEQLKDKTTHRVYKAIVHGVVPHKNGTIDAPIGRDEKDRKKMAVNIRHGKPAVTHFTVNQHFTDFTYVDCQLETGRTHQIRVHMAYIGHPVAGDPKYGPKKTLNIDGQALHAAELGFTHPRTGERLTFSAPIPEDMTGLLEELDRE